MVCILVWFELVKQYADAFPRCLDGTLGGHITPGQGGSAELVGAALIGTAAFTGLPVSTRIS